MKGIRLRLVGKGYGGSKGLQADIAEKHSGSRVAKAVRGYAGIQAEAWPESVSSRSARAPPIRENIDEEARQIRPDHADAKTRPNDAPHTPQESDALHAINAHVVQPDLATTRQFS